ncbi:WD40-repeat-containing domain protein [Pilobolus umbonatus]|nr:WD40-repeat-containing domain protein [Pilobolus umbonatus]
MHPDTHSLPPHEQSYVKIHSASKLQRKSTRIVLAQALSVDLDEIQAAYDIPYTEKSKLKEPVHAIWAIQFSLDGRYMATGGQDCIICIWKTLRVPEKVDNIDMQDLFPQIPSIKVFHDTPARTYTGHLADILDLSWSKHNFLLSSSMDSTVRLWHISQEACLCVFNHPDVVTSVEFHPKNDRYFLSGSMDGRIRLWSIPDKKVIFWNEINSRDMITAVAFSLDGRTACAGSDEGDVFFFETQLLKYNTHIVVKRRSAKRGRKVTSIEFLPCMIFNSEKILVTTNDSTLWLINMKDKSYVYHYGGHDNSVMQIRAALGDDGNYIMCGSEDGSIHLWKTDLLSRPSFQYLEESPIRAAVALGQRGEQILQVSCQDVQPKGKIKCAACWIKRKERRISQKMKRKSQHFMAHQHAVSATSFAPLQTRMILARSRGDIIFEHTPVYVNKKQLDAPADDNASTYSGSTASSYDSYSEIYNQIDIDFLRQSIMEELKEANDEERDYFHFPDSQIIASSDIHGVIKVWRMDSGDYTDSHHSDQLSTNPSEHASNQTDDPSPHRISLKGLFRHK